MKKTAAIAVAVAIALSAGGCVGSSGTGNESEHYCEFCGEYFTSGGSVSALYDGGEAALCEKCYDRVKMCLVEEYYKGMY